MLVAIDKAEIDQITRAIAEIRDVMHSPKAANELVLDIKGAADYLKVSVHKIQTLKKSRQIAFSQDERSVYFRVADLDKYLDRHYVQAKK